ncbi:hypothetical protein [Pseudomonas sp. DWP3-1-2]|uniref:hypothetical protein n=1 Tax=Pseudomonas sp. DWP3-1-2 TaxID=2804645 RepID=UPI003CF77874
MRFRSPIAALSLFFALLVLTFADAKRGAYGAEVDDSAHAFVQDRHLGESLGWLGYQVASRTATFASIVEAIGKTQAQALVKDELERLQPEYQEQWDRNLAAAYAQFFSAEELRNMNSDNGAQMLANKLRAKQNDVGMDMKARSAELLKTYVSRALNNAQRTLEH